ncbi:C40 family peptidase [Peribacillus faecalis]|nr:C40 family peptidase [Peribacillus faecalis]
MKKVINVPVATVWTKPDDARNCDQAALTAKPDVESWLNKMTDEKRIDLYNRNLVQTQVLYGEEVIVTEDQGEWSAVFIPSQASCKNSYGYPGFIHSAQLIEKQKKSSDNRNLAIVNVHKAELVTEKVRLFLSFGTILAVDKIAGEIVYVETPAGKGYIDLENVKLNDGLKGDGASLLELGKRFLGLPYLWGGNSSFGYDCSGFVYSMCRANGYLIPRDAGDQSKFGTGINLTEIKPGDALFFAHNEGSGAIHHVGLYVGEGEMLHSPCTGKAIEILKLQGTIYEKELCVARRYAVK